MKASNLRFGIEIECYVPSGTTERGQSHMGEGAQINWAPEGWGGKPDGSLSNSRYDGYTAVEVVSPILSGEDGLSQVYYIVESIKALNGKVDESCGLHVHVDATHLTEADVLAVKATFVKYEKAFFALCGSKANDRMGNYYCSPSNGVDGWDGLRSDRENRYRSLNLTNHYGHGHGFNTVEFRVWFGSLDVATVVAAVYMAVGIVAKASESGPDAGVRISDYEAAVNAFVAACWANPDYRILPDCTVNEVVRVAKRQARKANGR